MCSNELNSKDLLSILSPIVAVLAAYIAIRNTNLAIRMSRLKDIIDSVALFLSEVNPSKYHWDKFKKKEYVSDQHIILESKIIMLLNPKKKVENELIEKIKSFRTSCEDDEQYKNFREDTIRFTQEIANKERFYILFFKSIFKRQ